MDSVLLLVIGVLSGAPYFALCALLVFGCERWMKRR